MTLCIIQLHGVRVLWQVNLEKVTGVGGLGVFSKSRSQFRARVGGNHRYGASSCKTSLGYHLAQHLLLGETSVKGLGLLTAASNRSSTMSDLFISRVRY